MKNVLVDEPVSLTFSIVEDGEFATPDPDSMTYSLRDNAGERVVGQTDVPVSVSENQTSVTVEIDGVQNSKAKDFEFRTVELKYKINGESRSVRRSYRVIDYLPYQTSINDVRNFLGLAQHELNEDDVDLVAVYYEVMDDVDAAIFTQALIAGGITTLRANDAIMAKACLKVIPSLQLRALQSEKGMDNSASRFQSINWDRLHVRAETLYADMIRQISPNAPENVRPFITKITPTDPVTGI